MWVCYTRSCARAGGCLASNGQHRLSLGIPPVFEFLNIKKRIGVSGHRIPVSPALAVSILPNSFVHSLSLHERWRNERLETFVGPLFFRSWLFLQLYSIIFLMVCQGVKEKNGNRRQRTVADTGLYKEYNQCKTPFLEDQQKIFNTKTADASMTHPRLISSVV